LPRYARLEELDAERDALTDRLERLASQSSSGTNCKSAGASVTAASTAAEKITLFRRLFAGRSEVFPVRWENRNTAKSGYAPACASCQFHGPGHWRNTSVACIVMHDGKREVIVYDCLDRAVPVLARMAAKREKGYKALGYVLES
jgi:hypothetical protein